MQITHYQVYLLSLILSFTTILAVEAVIPSPESRVVTMPGDALPNVHSQRVALVRAWTLVTQRALRWNPQSARSLAHELHGAVDKTCFHVLVCVFQGECLWH